MTGISDLIDSHTHAQPSAAAGRAFVRNAGHEPVRDGDIDDLLASMKRAGIVRTVIVPWLPAQDMVQDRVAAGADRDQAVAEVVAKWRQLNGWAASLTRAHPDQISCLVGIDPVLMGEEVVRQEVAERLAAGACGLKVAPGSIYRRPNDPVMEVVWRTAREHGVFVLSESGAYPWGRDEKVWGHPSFFADVLRSYPSVTVQLAHIGRGAEDDVAHLTAEYPNVVTDISLRLLAENSPEKTARLIHQIGADRVLFGSCFPAADQIAYSEALRALPLSEDDLRLVGHDNAAHLLGLNLHRLADKSEADGAGT